jgi:hypothetical protein
VHRKTAFIANNQIEQDKVTVSDRDIHKHYTEKKPAAKKPAKKTKAKAKAKKRA